MSAPIPGFANPDDATHARIEADAKARASRVPAPKPEAVAPTEAVVRAALKQELMARKRTRKKPAA